MKMHQPLRGNIPYIKRMLEEIDSNIVRALKEDGRKTLCTVSDALDELLQRMQDDEVTA